MPSFCGESKQPAVAVLLNPKTKKRGFRKWKLRFFVNRFLHCKFGKADYGCFFLFLPEMTAADAPAAISRTAPAAIAMIAPVLKAGAGAAFAVH